MCIYLWIYQIVDHDHTKKTEFKKTDDKKEKGSKLTFRGTAKAMSLASKLSPKLHHKKEKNQPNFAQLKVCVH